MKQLISGLIVLTSSFFPISMLAAGSATMGFSQENLTLQVGQMADVFLTIDPKGENLDTVRSVFTLDPTILQVESIVQVGKFNHNAPGNFIDNQKGKVSWGAFTLEGPINTIGPYLKVSLSARQTGTALIALTEESKLISNGEEKISSLKLGSLTVKVDQEPSTDPGLSVLTVNSASHPQESSWYALSNIQLDWIELKGESEIVNYVYAFDQTSNTDPSTFLAPTETTRSFEDVKDGIHYFHLKGIQKDGKKTKTVHRRILIDTQEPNPIAITVFEDQLIEGESLWLTFATTDETSGIAQYQVAINTSEFLPQESPLEITDLVPGTYFIRVAAIDNAGNTVNQGQSVRVYPKGTKLVRPDGFDPNSEKDSFTDDPLSIIPSSPSLKLLITLGLVLALGFGIIYKIKNRNLNK